MARFILFLKSYKNLSVLALLALIVFLGVLGPYFYHFKNGFSDNQNVWGAFGDYIGGILNPIFGFVTVLILLYTMKLQAKELRKTKKLNKKQARILDLQLSTMRQQIAEGSFFRVLEFIGNDNALKACKKEAGKIYLACYAMHKKIHDEGLVVKDGDDLSVIFKRFSSVPLGEFRYSAAERVAMAVELANQCSNKQLMLKMLSVEVDPVLLSAMFHHARDMGVEGVFNRFASGADVLRGLDYKFFFNEDIARLSMGRERFKKYCTLRPDILERLSYLCDSVGNKAEQPPERGVNASNEMDTKI